MLSIVGRVRPVSSAESAVLLIQNALGLMFLSLTLSCVKKSAVFLCAIGQIRLAGCWSSVLPVDGRSTLFPCSNFPSEQIPCLGGRLWVSVTGVSQAATWKDTYMGGGGGVPPIFFRREFSS